MENQCAARTKEVKKLLNSSLEEIVHLHPHLKRAHLPKGSSEKHIISSAKSSKDKTLLEKVAFIEHVKKIIVHTFEIAELPLRVLNIPRFLSFDICHILVHEKGKPIGHNYSCLHGQTQAPKTITIQNFNAIFNLVKKSKNKIFNQSTSNIQDLSLVGTFLAKEIELKTHSIIYLISRNSFIPPSEDEQSDFNSLSAFLPSLLSKTLDKEKIERTTGLIKKAIENFPENISIKENFQTIFKNNATQFDEEKTNLMIFPLNESGLSMEISNISKEQISTEIYHSQRIALLGELLNTLQHELSNPLFGLNLTSSLLAPEAPNEDSQILLEEISLNANRSQNIIKNFSNLYNANKESKKIKIKNFVEEIITLTKSETKEIPKHIKTINFGTENDLEINTNPNNLTQIIFNLIINSAQAIKELKDPLRNHSILIELEKLEHELKISIIDDGPGINEENLQTIFKPFFTTKESGTGLGLAICQNLAQQLGTKIHFQNNSPLLGATFSINLAL